MRKWRPGHKCVYIIPEIRGNLNSLEVILNRILPLRKFVGQEDVLICVGGFIDGDEYGPEVLDALITIRKEYGDRAIFIRGDHEEMFLRAISGSEKDYQYWIQNGGSSTLEGYVRLSGLRSSSATIPQTRLKDIIPQSHIDFLQSLPYFYELENYFFFHGGINPKIPLSDNNPITFAFDTVSNRLYKAGWKGDVEKIVPDDRIFVGTHNSGKKPVIYPRWFMLGEAAPKSLLCLELNSMECVKAKRGKSRIYKTLIKIYE